MLETSMSKSILVTILVACPTMAQTNNFAILVGAYSPIASVSAQPVRVTTSVSAGLMLSYGHRLASSRAGDLLLDVPLAVSARANQSVSRGINIGGGTDAFFTPGVRLAIVPASVVRPYAVIGLGVGSFSGGHLSISRDVDQSRRRSTSPVVGFGGGLDVHLVRFLSLRGEIRDFVSRAGFGGVEGRHHVVVGVGLSFHFR